jgi:hypothetical protein
MLGKRNVECSLYGALFSASIQRNSSLLKHGLIEVPLRQ